MTIRAENEMTLVRVDDGSAPYIGADKYWYIDGVSTGIKAEGTDGYDGTPIVWKGSLASAPSNPVVDWCYRNTTDGKVYIYNGSAWVLMTQDGVKGADGTSAYEAAIAGGLPSETIEEQFNSYLADVPNKANQGDLDAVAVSVSSLIANLIATINLAAGTINADKIDVDTLTTQQAFITALETSLIDAGAITVQQLDSGEISSNVVNAINMSTGTLNVSRIIYTDPTTLESYFVEMNPAIYSVCDPQPTQAEFNSNKTHFYILDGGKYIQCTEDSVYDSTETYYEYISATPSYRKVSGSVIDDLSITADKISAGAITANKLSVGQYMQFIQTTGQNPQPLLILGNGSEFVTAVSNRGMRFYQGISLAEIQADMANPTSTLAIAYFDNNQMKINRGVIVDRLQTGRFRWESQSNNNLTFRWIGA